MSITWGSINTMLTSGVVAGKPKTLRAVRPFAAMPRWFKRFVKRMNREFDLAGNLALKPVKRVRRRKVAA